MWLEWSPAWSPGDKPDTCFSRKWLWRARQEFLFQNTHTLNGRKEVWCLLVNTIIHLLIHIFFWLFVSRSKQSNLKILTEFLLCTGAILKYTKMPIN